MSQRSRLAPSKLDLVNVQIDGVWHAVPERHARDRSVRAGGQLRAALLLSSEAHLAGQLPDVPDRNGHAEDGAGSQAGTRIADGKPKINWMPRPQISCAQDVAEAWAFAPIRRWSQECRKGVMEFLLINHPLDCPICDQAGECRLQEFSVEYGSARSRFLENKVKKPKNVELGPRVTLDDERCILCSRCIRFCKEIAKDDVLGFVDRGSYYTF